MEADVALQGKPKRGGQQFQSLEKLFGGTLPRSTTAVDLLCLRQGGVIRVYAGIRLDTPGLALELPTSTGETLPGLLIGE